MLANYTVRDVCVILKTVFGFLQLNCCHNPCNDMKKHGKHQHLLLILLFSAIFLQPFQMKLLGYAKEGGKWLRGAVASWVVISTPERAVRVRSSLKHGHCVCSQPSHFTPTIRLFTQVYKWVPANLMLGWEGEGVTLRWTSIPSKEEQKYCWSLYATKAGISCGLMSH